MRATELVEAVSSVCAGVPDALDEAGVAALMELGDTWQRRHGPTVDDVVVEALTLAVRAHAGQRRASGELYISHPVQVASIVCDSGLDAASIAAACCHDVLEDCAVGEEEIAGRLGAEVLSLVRGVTKVDKVNLPVGQDAESVSMTRFLVAVVEDVRVLVIKLADRLHNMRTIGVLGESTRVRKARETLEVFSPLAHRLGMEDLRCELEDLAFEQVDPQAYRAITAAVTEMSGHLAQTEHSVVERLRTLLEQAGVTARIDSRTKHMYSIWEKQQRSGTTVAAMHDLVGVRVVVEDVTSCYQVLGVVHGAWVAVPGRFKDFVSVPRASGYRSLHTTVIEGGLDVEIQIRTEEMDLQARFGIASHYLYKHTAEHAARDTGRRVRDSELVAALQLANGPEEFLSRLREELVPRSQIVVLTPKGRAVLLPAGSCAIDFAYHVHTEVGHRCVGARVDGVLVPIRSALPNGAVVEIICAKRDAARRDWLDVVRTSRAREKIRRHLLDAQGSTPAEVTGRTMLAEELKRRGAEESLAHDRAFLARLAQLAGRHDGEELLAHLAAGQLRVGALRGLPARAVARRGEGGDGASTVRIEALGGLPFSVARCCNPTSVDEAAGFVSSARVVSVHRTDCPNYLSMVRALPAGEVGRLLPIAQPGAGRAWVEITAADRQGLLFELAQACSEAGSSIVASTTRTDRGIALVRFELDIVDEDHLRAVCETLRSVGGVSAVASSGGR